MGSVNCDFDPTKIPEKLTQLSSTNLMGNIKRFDNMCWTIFSVMSCHSQTSSHTISVSISSSFMFQLQVVTVKSAKEAMPGQWPLIALNIEKRQSPDTCAIKGRWPYHSFKVRLYKSLASPTSVAYSWVHKKHRYHGCDPKHKTSGYNENRKVRTSG